MREPPDRGGPSTAGRLLAPWLALVAALVVFVANRLITPRTPLLPRALLDEAVHTATTALALSATPWRERPLLVSAFATAVLIDVDHAPDTIFGCKALSQGSPRPYSHSLLTLTAVLIAGRAVSSERRPAIHGVAFGLAVHLLRDITDGSDSAPLLWPLSRRGVRLSRRLQALLVLASRLWAVRRS